MERKSKNRMLGILILVGLVIVLIPFFVSNKDLKTTNVATLQPLPEEEKLAENNDQPVASPSPIVETPIAENAQKELVPTESVVAENTSAGIQSEALPNEQVVTETPVEQNQTIVNPQTTNEAPVPAMNNEVAPEKKSFDSSENSSPAPAMPMEETTSNTQASTAPENNQVASTPTADVINKQEIQVEKKSTAPKIQTTAIKKKTIVASKKSARVIKLIPLKPMDESVEDGLEKITHTAWVIQVGSFKEKSHAVKLANELRANGYDAFIQKVSHIDEDKTRVYVGPEFASNKARLLSDRINQTLHIKGMVIKYQPMGLTG